MAEPPSFDGGDHEATRLFVPSDCRTTRNCTFRGSDGRVTETLGVLTVVVAAALVPMAFLAVTVMVYVVPGIPE